MKLENSRQEWYDASKRVAVTFVDVKDAAQALAKGHLSGPVATTYLSKALAAAALLGAEIDDERQTLIIQMKCNGPLGGYNVECTARGTLRGYTEKKILDQFDGMGKFSDKDVIGEAQIQVTRSIPGKIVSQGISNSLDGYLAGSLQRKACIYLEASVTDDVEVKEARGVLVEALPDSQWSVALGTNVLHEDLAKGKAGVLALSPRNILAALGLEGAELKKTTGLSFACRCSPERAIALISSMSKEERASLPEKIDITCHMCGRTFTVSPGV